MPNSNTRRLTNTNTNRDLLMQIDVKNSIVNGGGFNFYITDKNTSNFFVKLVINMSTNPIISRYVAIEEARNYNLILKYLKPNGELVSLEGELISEEEALFQYNLAEYQKDMVGVYKCEYWIQTTVSGVEEIITTAPFQFTVLPSIINDLDDIIDDPEQYPIYQELLNRVIDMEDGLKDADLSFYATKDYVDEEIENALANFDDDVEIDLTDYVTKTELSDELSAKPDMDDIPTRVSQLANDSNYLTSVPTEYAKKSDLPSLEGYATETYVVDKINQAQLEGGEGNEIDLSAYALKSDLNNLVAKEVGNANQIRFSDGETFQEKLDTGELKGERGIQGPQGPEGPQGIQGEPGLTPIKGVDYFDGAKGEKGDNGITPTIRAGTVTTGNAGTSANVTASTSGTTTTFNFTIPRGDTGEKGKDGVTPTIKVGSVTTGNAGTSASVTANTGGTTTTFNFTIPRGANGQDGNDGEKGKDGLTTSIKVNNQTYTQSNGVITLPNYPTVSTDAQSVDGLSFWTGTQSQYDALSSKSSTTVYLIKEG